MGDIAGIFHEINHPATYGGTPWPWKLPSDADSMYLPEDLGATFGPELADQAASRCDVCDESFSGAG